MSRLFDKILVEGARKGHLPGRTEQAREWFRNRAKRTFIFSKSRFISKSDRERLSQQPASPIGSMYLFKYDPKYANELPYYDKFPLIFFIDEGREHFLGINLHYLPPPLRAQLMDALYTITNNNRYNKTTKLRISYETLKSMSTAKAFEPCVKKYLKKQVRSQFMYINPAEWDIALMMPLQSFSKAGKEVVWSDSKRKLLN